MYYIVVLTVPSICREELQIATRGANVLCATADVCSRMLAYADVCWRMLTFALLSADAVRERLVCYRRRMLTYTDAC